MSKKIINIGRTANDRSGDPIRTAFTKVNENFTELYDHVSAGVVVDTTPPTAPGAGDLWWDPESGRMYVYYGTSWVDASPVDGVGISSTTQLVNGAYTVSLGANGVLTLPDGSIINGSTIRGVAGTGELNYTGITIGPNSNDAEKTWMWVDHANAYVSTNNAANTWTFGNDGKLTLPGGGGLQSVGVTGADGRQSLASTRTDGSLFLTANSPTAGSVFLMGQNNYIISGSDISNGATYSQWTFGTDGILTFPGAAGFQATFGNVFPVGDVLHSVNNLHLESEQSVTVNSGDQVADLENNYINAEETWAIVRDEDASIIAPTTRPWAGLPSYEAYDILMGYTNPPGVLPPASNMAPTAKAASDAYDAWQEELTASGVNISVAGSHVWNFGANGLLTVPGAIFRSGSLYLNSEGETNAAYVLVDGQNGGIVLRTSDGTSFKSWFLNVNGETTLPGRLQFSDGSAYNNSRLTGAADSDLELEVKHRTTVSAVESVGDAVGGMFTTDITTNDDITVVVAGWELNAGTELEPSWIPVFEGIESNPGVYNILIAQIDLPVGFEFVQGSTYTFRNPTPVSKVWTINNQNGTLIAPGNAILSNETADLGGGDTYRDFSIELPTPDESNEQRWTFSNDGELTLPDNSVIASYKPVTVIAATTTTQTISDNASAAFIQFVDTVDTANAFSTGVFAVPYTGYYQVNLSVYFSTTVTLGATSFLLIDTNLDFTKQVRIIDGSWTGSYLHYSTVISASAEDAVRIAIRQVSGGDIDILSGSRLTIHRVSIS